MTRESWVLGITREELLREVCHKCKLREKQPPPLRIQLLQVQSIRQAYARDIEDHNEYDWGQGALTALQECQKSLESNNNLMWVVEELTRYEEARDRLSA